MFGRNRPADAAEPSAPAGDAAVRDAVRTGVGQVVGRAGRARGRGATRVTAEDLARGAAPAQAEQGGAKQGGAQQGTVKQGGAKQGTVKQVAAERPEGRAGGKGRPTPTRREAEQKGRQPLVGGTRLSPNATKAERKAARTAQRTALAAERLKSREAMVTGDDRFLPPQHRGPARRWARDYVDARRNLGELLLPTAFVVLLLGLVPRLQVVSLVLVPALYVFALAVAVNGWFLARRVGRMVTERFGADAARGVGRYAAFRSAQLRRFRLPKAQVRRGQFPA